MLVVLGVFGVLVAVDVLRVWVYAWRYVCGAVCEAGPDGREQYMGTVGV